MSTNEAHFAAIREALDAGYDPLDDWEYLSGKSREEIDYHLAQLEGHASDARAMGNNLLRELADARRERDAATARVNALSEARARRFAEAEENSAAYWERIADHHYEKRKEAEARAERWRKWAELLEIKFSEEAGISVESTRRLRVMYLQPTDLAPDAPGDTADGRLMDRRNRPDV